MTFGRYRGVRDVHTETEGSVSSPVTRNMLCATIETHTHFATLLARCENTILQLLPIQHNTYLKPLFGSVLDLFILKLMNDGYFFVLLIHVTSVGATSGLHPLCLIWPFL